MDDIRARYLRERVLTASPAQRIVMMYDRLMLDLERAKRADDTEFAKHIGHGVDVLAELLGSLDHGAGGPADNLASIYGFLISELVRMRASGENGRLDVLMSMIARLRDAWIGAAEQLASADSANGPAAGTLTRTA